MTSHFELLSVSSTSGPLAAILRTRDVPKLGMTDIFGRNRISVLVTVSEIINSAEFRPKFNLQNVHKINARFARDAVLPHKNWF